MRTTTNDPRRWVGVAPLVAFLMMCVPAFVRGQDDTDSKLGDNGIPEGYMVVEGDIIVPIDFYERVGRGTFTSLSYLWTEGDPTIIPYEFEDPDANCGGFWCVNFGPCSPYCTNPCDHVIDARRTVATNAMAEWEAVANVDFRPRSGEAAYIHIRDSSNDCNPANNSLVGRLGEEQTLNFNNWTNQWTLVHELGHALGYWHEQSRADRDTACDGGPCVTIEWSNISQTACTDANGNSAPCYHNFEVRDTGDEYGDYDFDSIMHYRACAFTCCNNQGTGCFGTTTCTPAATNCRTITVEPPNGTVWQSNIGQGGTLNHLSCWDAEVMSFLYPESDWTFVDADCQWYGTSGSCITYGDFLRPYTNINTAIDQTPCGGELILRSGGDFNVNGVLSKPMLIRAPVGGAILCD